ncbi:Flagellar hook-associated protein 1, partial [Candidatus Arthromitus sp. SFB-3]
GGDENSITAGNISVNTTLLDDPMKLKVRKNDHMFDDATQNTIDGQGDGDRALAIASLRDKLFNISDIGKTINSREDFFNPNKGGSELINNGLDINSAKSGTKIESQYKNMVTTVGIRSQEAAREADN